jgi:hypothetical protein
MNTRLAIPNTTEEVRYQIRLDSGIPEHPSFVYGDGGGGRIPYCLVAKYLQGRKLNRDREFYAVGSSCHVGRWGIRMGGVAGVKIGGSCHVVNTGTG